MYVRGAEDEIGRKADLPAESKWAVPIQSGGTIGSLPAGGFKVGAGASKPSTETLKTLAALYDVPLEYLLNEDDPGPAHVERRTGENTEVGHHKKPKWFALMLVGIGIMAVILCSTFFQDRNENPVSMNNIEGSEVEVEEAFDLEW